MAVIQKIRDKYGKIAGAVIAISLISFIVSDARNGSFGGMFGGHKTDVMTINGTKIESKEYEQRVKEYEVLTQIFSTRGAAIGDEQRSQIREQVMQTIAFEAVVADICEKMGIDVSEQEKKDLLYSPNAHQLVRNYNIEGQQIFNNPDTKQFDPARVKGFEEQLKTDPRMDPYGKIAEQWNAIKAYVVRSAKFDKFNILMGSSAYVPSYEAKHTQDDQAQMASIRYVKVPYTTINDNEVKVSDEDIKAYMQKHKGFYEVDQATRTLEYLAFEIQPAPADSMRSRVALEEMKDEFSKTTDNKTFVGNKSDDFNSYSEAYTSKKNFTSPNADTIMAQPVGSIYGPYMEAGSYKITKIVDKKTLPDSAKSRHILVRFKNGAQDIMSDSAAKNRIDSIVAAIKAGASFDSMVAKHSDDDGSKATKGEYWFNLMQRPNISKEFGDVAFERPVGTKEIVKADNSKTGGYAGYHYIEVLEQKGEAPTVKMATITKSLMPSDSTVDAIFGKANEFAGKSTDAKAFDANAKALGMDKRIAEGVKESSYAINGIGSSSRDVVKWAFQHKVGDVASAPFRINDQRYVVTKLTNIEEKGLMAITPANRPMFEQRVKEEKKAEIIANKFKGAALDAIAQGTGQTVAQYDSLSLAMAPIPGLGYEPKVTGYAFSSALAPNTVSPGLKGQGGVFFISLNTKGTKAPSPMDQMMLMQIRGQAEQQLKGYLGQAMQQSLTRNADIKYNIANF